MLEVVFLTSAPKKDLPTHVTIRSTGRKSEALCEQPTPVSVERINNFVGKASEKEMEQIDIALLIGLGIKLAVEGEIRTGSYTNREGRKVYTTEIYVSDIEFAESKAAAEQNQNRNDDQYGMTGDDGFMNIPDGEELPPFN